MGGEQARDLRDGEDGDKVEEELERGDLVLGVALDLDLDLSQRAGMTHEAG